MKIIESLIKSKRGDSDGGEDILLVTDQYVAVIDGATSKSSALFEGKTGGRIAGECLVRCLSNPSWGRKADARTVINSLQSYIKEYSLLNALDQIHLCASAVIYSIAQRQVWAVGDCQFMMNGELHSFGKKVDLVLSETRSLAIQMLMASGVSEEDLRKNDKGREMILPFLKMQKLLENSPSEYGYSVFSDQGEVQSFSVTDVPPGAELVLASDGYPDLRRSLKESEEALERLLREDPLCYKVYKSTKGLAWGQSSFDDRCYVRLVVD